MKNFHNFIQPNINEELKPGGDIVGSFRIYIDDIEYDSIINDPLYKKYNSEDRISIYDSDGNLRELWMLDGDDEVFDWIKEHVLIDDNRYFDN